VNENFVLLLARRPLHLRFSFSFVLKVPRISLSLHDFLLSHPRYHCFHPRNGILMLIGLLELVLLLNHFKIGLDFFILV